MIVAALAASGAVRESHAQRPALQELSLLKPAERQSVPDSRKVTPPPKPYGRVPPSFEQNMGQTGSPVKFLFRTADSTVFLTASSIVLALGGDPVRTEETEPTALRINFFDANPAPEVTGVNQLPGKSHYLIGNDREKWHTGIPSFASVHYRSIYPGIDLVFSSKGQQLEYRLRGRSGSRPACDQAAI